MLFFGENARLSHEKLFIKTAQGITYKSLQGHVYMYMIPATSQVFLDRDCAVQDKQRNSPNSWTSSR